MKTKIFSNTEVQIKSKLKSTIMNNQIAVGIQEQEFTAQFGFGFKKKTTLNLRVSEYQLFHMIQLKSKFQQFIEAAKYQLKFLIHQTKLLLPLQKVMM